MLASAAEEKVYRASFVGGFVEKAKRAVPRPFQVIESFGERGRIRTCDPCLKRALLYQLSYAPHKLQNATVVTGFYYSPPARLAALFHGSKSTLRSLARCSCCECSPPQFHSLQPAEYCVRQCVANHPVNPRSANYSSGTVGSACDWFACACSETHKVAQPKAAAQVPRCHTRVNHCATVLTGTVGSK